MIHTRPIADPTAPAAHGVAKRYILYPQRHHSVHTIYSPHTHAPPPPPYISSNLSCYSRAVMMFTRAFHTLYPYLVPDSQYYLPPNTDSFSVN
ncbi:hypothetical protein H0H93_015769 [Arthromyces matolae]|nr:hypothetical protein H0H93_015769 [Arthromyces matolae]